MDLLIILIVGLFAGVISGIIGTGSSVMLLPFLAYAYGPKAAVPIMAVAALMANASRILLWWREIDRQAFTVYALTGAPAAVLGARTMLVLPSYVVDAAIGVFFLTMVPVRHWLSAHLIRLQLSHLMLAGAAIGFLTGVVVSTGPLSVPVFIGYGLTKGAFIDTEAAASLAIYLTKVATFQNVGALPYADLVRGLSVGTTLMLGASIAKPFVLRLAPETFRRVMDGLILVAGISLLWNAAVQLGLQHAGRIDAPALVGVVHREGDFSLTGPPHDVASLADDHRVPALLRHPKEGDVAHEVDIDVLVHLPGHEAALEGEEVPVERLVAGPADSGEHAVPVLWPESTNFNGALVTQGASGGVGPRLHHRRLVP